MKRCDARPTPRVFPLPGVVALALALGVAGCGDRDAPRRGGPAIADAARGARSPASTEAPVAATTAAAPGDPALAHFRRLDADGNGRVTPAEHVQGAAALFAAMDADGDGNVTAAEMDAAQAAVGGDPRVASADKIRAIDNDGDGALTAAEHAGGSRTMFATLDTSADGTLDLPEVRDGHARLLGGAREPVEGNAAEAGD